MKSHEIPFKKGKLISGIVYPEFFPISSDESVLNVGCGDCVQALVYKGKFKKMVGVDVNTQRLNIADQLKERYNLVGLTTLYANVEAIPLDENNERFDKVLAIDIIEHIENPKKLVSEVRRLLKDDGQALFTFPAMHDRWVDLFRFIGRKILRRKPKTIEKSGWDPDAHAHDHSVKKWTALIEAGGFHLVASRASTMFPPLHFLGIPRFWFSNKIIHHLDSFFCQLPLVKNYGQTLLCIFEKKL